MRRTVRLTERDLTRLVKRIIREGLEEEIGGVILSQVKEGTKGTYYVQNGKLLINENGGGMTMEVMAG